jgi:hypothetical protein
MPRLTSYPDAACVFLWTSPIIENFEQENVWAKNLALISIKVENDCIETASNRCTSRLVADQSWHPLAQGQERALRDLMMARIEAIMARPFFL